MAEEKKMTSAENGSVYEEGALKIQKLTPLQVVFTVVGCGVGSGCLGTAYGARLAGFYHILADCIGYYNPVFDVLCSRIGASYTAYDAASGSC